MDKYKICLQVCAIIFICFLIYLLYRFIISVLRKKRLNSFAIDLEKEKYLDDSLLMKIIFGLSNILSSMVIFNGIGRMYDKYVNEDSRLRKGMDYLSIKTWLGIIFIFVYLFVCFLYKDSVNVVLVITCFILGFIIPDFYCLLIKSKRKKYINKHILRAVIIMNSSFKANRTVEQAVSDVIQRVGSNIDYEFKKVLNDIKLGLSLSESFKRMYNRTNSDIVLRMCNALDLADKGRINVVDIFNDIEKELLEEEKFNNELEAVKSMNSLALGIFIILPLVFIVYVILLNNDYINLLNNKTGGIIIVILGIIYLLYVFILKRIARGKCV